ncbi:phosphoribosyltransferase [Caldisphaera sp.]|uniref:phosphoribosyltransferase n=1 Tax=Caldisphaera sp. TaxID=2060322 RepID=UPI0025BE9B21|nr:phosphoribosyltransferase [Caldisphaera sp.]
MPKVPVKLVGWSEIVDWTFNLSKIIEGSGYKPDIVVAVARGGYVPARLLCDFLGISDLLSVQSQHWVEAAKVTQKAILRHPFKIDAEDKNILIVDDIVDTGETLKLAKDFIKESWNPKDARTASLQWISTVAKYKPDYYLIEVKDWSWFQYPWTRLEDVMEFIERIFKEDVRAKNGLNYEELKKIFSEWYGISNEDLGYYWDLAFERLLSKKIIVKNEDKYYYGL